MGIPPPRKRDMSREPRPIDLLTYAGDGSCRMTCEEDSRPSFEIRHATRSTPPPRILPPDGAAPQRPNAWLSGRPANTGRGHRLLGSTLQLRRRRPTAAERPVRCGLACPGRMDHGARPALSAGCTPVSATTSRDWSEIGLAIGRNGGQSPCAAFVV